MLQESVIKRLPTSQRCAEKMSSWFPGVFKGSFMLVWRKTENIDGQQRCWANFELVEAKTEIKVEWIWATYGQHIRLGTNTNTFFNTNLHQFWLQTWTWNYRVCNLPFFLLHGLYHDAALAYSLWKDRRYLLKWGKWDRDAELDLSAGSGIDSTNHACCLLSWGITISPHSDEGAKSANHATERTRV